MAMKFSKRERYILYAASGIIGLFVLFHFIIFPLIDKRDRLTRTLQVKTEMLEDILVLKSEYDAIDKETELPNIRFAKGKNGDTLFSLLEKIAGEAGIKDRIAYMKPSTSLQKGSSYKISMVEMKLQAVILKQLISFLHRVETSNNMAMVRRLSISKTGKQKDFISAVLLVETIRNISVIGIK